MNNRWNRLKSVGSAYLFLVGFSILLYLLGRKTSVLPTGADVWLKIVFGYWAALIFILAQIGWGKIILDIGGPFSLKKNHFEGPLRLFFLFGTGFYFSSIILMVLALLKYLKSPGILIYIIPALAVSPFGLTECKKVLKEIKFWGKKLPSSVDKRALHKKKIVFIVLIAVFILPFFFQSLLPNSDWDGAAYHLPLAERFLEGRIFQVVPEFDTYNFPGGAHLIYALFLAIGAEQAVIAFNFILAAALVLFVYILAAEIWSRRAALWAAVVCVGLNILWEVALTPRIDSLQAFFTVVACGTFIYWTRYQEKTGLLIFTGMILGISLGIKYTAMFPAAVISLAAAAVTLWVFRKNLKRAVVLLVLFSIVIIIPSGWWYARNFVLLGDPLYPYFSGPLYYDESGELRELLPDLHRLIKDMPPAAEIEDMGRKYDIPFLYRKTPFPEPPRNLLNLRDVIMHPGKYQRDDYHEINLLIFLFFLLPAFYRQRELWWLFGISFSLFLIIGSQSHILRYALPFLPLLALGSGVVISKIRYRAVTVVFILIASVSIGRFSFLEYKKLISVDAFSYLSGLKNAAEWLENTGYNGIKGMPEMIGYINRQIEKGTISQDNIIFMVGESKGYLIKCRYLPDSSRWAIQWLEELIKFESDYEKIYQSFKQKNINYILFNAGYAQGVAENYAWRREPLIFGIFHLLRFLEDYTDIVFSKNRIYFARLKP